MSLLYKFIDGTKYTGRTAVGRKNNDSVLKYQEPVGYRYFSYVNIERLLAALRPVHPAVVFSDIQQLMLDTFYHSGSSYAQYVNADDEARVSASVNMLNKITLKETNKRFGNNLNLHEQYQFVLENPNRLGANPKRTKAWTLEHENPYYGKEVAEQKEPRTVGYTDAASAKASSGIGNSSYAPVDY